MGISETEMKLLAGLLGSSLAVKGPNPFPRAHDPFCDTSGIKGSSCQDIYDSNPLARDGIYKIQVAGQSPTVVECKFDSGAGWTVIQKRSTGRLDFNRTWREYQRGFTTFSERDCAGQCTGEGQCGNESPSSMGPRPNCDLDEYWIGLDNIHGLMDRGEGVRMKVDLQRYNGEYGTVEYDNFLVGDAASNYQLKSVGNFKNDPNIDIGDSFVGTGFGKQGYSKWDKIDTNHVGFGFTTKDRDNDGYESGNCGKEDGSGWWFNRCSAVNLNGNHYGSNSGSLNYKESAAGYDNGILWQTWTNNKFESLIGTRMMIAPQPPKKNVEVTGSDCQEIAEKLVARGNKIDGLTNVYKITPKGLTVGKYTECKFQVVNGLPTGWTLVQKRYDGSVDFNQNWKAYRDGFGCEPQFPVAVPFVKKDPCKKSSTLAPSSIGECWLGNEYINALTGELGGASLQVEMGRRYDRDPNEAVVAYSRFSVGDEASNYRLDDISGFISIANNAGNAFWGSDFDDEGFGDFDKADTDHRGMQFSTNDRDNDLYEEGSCGKQDRSGWWFNRCSAANLNGHYYKNGLVDKNSNGFVEFDDGILWNTWTHTKWESIVKTKMWIGRKGAVEQVYMSQGQSHQESDFPEIEEHHVIRTTEAPQTAAPVTTERDEPAPGNQETIEINYDDKEFSSEYSEYSSYSSRTDDSGF